MAKKITASLMRIDAPLKVVAWRRRGGGVDAAEAAVWVLTHP